MASHLLQSASQFLSRMGTAVQKGDFRELLSCRARANHRHGWDIRFPFQGVVGVSKREILLTFDDGPHPINTPKLLDELGRAGIQATFFVIGKKIESSLGQEIIQRAAVEGHQIGNHTYSHSNLTKLTKDQIRQEILKTEKLIGDVSKGVKILRPPYGEHNSRVDQVAQELGYNLVLWTADGRDWQPDHQGCWVDHVMAQIVTQQQSIVLAHDIHTTTVIMVGALIAQIRELPGSSFIRYSAGKLSPV